ncbi:MAG: hypothetical protein RIR39_108 [Pseudomonadota bacterium]|jgi:hypothetical protein
MINRTKQAIPGIDTFLSFNMLLLPKFIIRLSTYAGIFFSRGQALRLPFNAKMLAG